MWLKFAEEECYSLLARKHGIDAQVLVYIKEGQDASPPVPSCRLVKLLCNPRKHLMHNLLNPPAAQESEDVSFGDLSTLSG